MTLHFLHAADLHLDSPLRGLGAYELAPVERIRGATRRAFTRLIDTAIARKVPFVVLAGDVWDGDWPDVGTGLFFAAEMGRLEQAGIRAFLIRGNHDAESRLTRAVPFPENVHVFRADRPETVRLDDLGVALHGQSYARPDLTDNIAAGYPAAVPEAVNIGLLHTALEGHPPHAPYAPCRLADLQAKGYDYWALGHVHERAILADGQSGAEGGTVAFSGVLQGRHARETGAKGALAVEIGADGVAVEALTLDVVRWHRLEIDVADCAELEAAARAAGQALRALVETPDNERHHARHQERRLHAVRLRLTGRSPIHGVLRFERARLREAILAQASAAAPEDLFVEKVEVATRPARDSAELARRHDAVAELDKLLDQAAGDGALLAALSGQLAELLGQLPAEVLAGLEAQDPATIAAARSGDLSERLPDLRAELIDRLAEA